MRVAIDTNVLIYAISGGDEAKRQIAQTLLRRLKPANVCLPAQAAGEFYNVVVRKLKRSPEAAIRILTVWADVYGFRPAGQPHVLAALDLARDHNFQMWDSLIVNVAAAEGCSILLSEDMQSGFVYRGVTIANPFADAPHPLLKFLLDSLPESL